MISTKLEQEMLGLDEIITLNDPDFRQNGLKSISIIQVSRLAIVAKSQLLGKIRSHFPIKNIANTKQFS